MYKVLIILNKTLDGWGRKRWSENDDAGWVIDDKKVTHLMADHDDAHLKPESIF